MHNCNTVYSNSILKTIIAYLWEKIRFSLINIFKMGKLLNWKNTNSIINYFQHELG